MLKQSANLVPRERKQMKKAKSAYRRYELVLLWLFLPAIVLSQLAFSAHQFGHEDTSHTENCPVCVVFERDYDDDVVPIANTAYASSAAAEHEPQDECGAVPADQRTSYRTRASP